ncbi:MAG: ABC transporter permease [Pirellulaceae bacterium]|nr:ABC transporter permease [Pirellulaceae bacterium]
MMTTFNPLKQLILARLREFTREPAAVFWVYGFPLIMILALGIAFRSEPIEVVHVGVEEGESATTLLESLEESERFNAVVVSATDAAGLLRTSKIEVLVRGVSGESMGEPVMEYQFDPSRPGSLLARNAVDDYMQRAAGRKDVLESRDIEVREAGSRYVDFLVPGLIGMSLMGGGMWGVGYAIVDLRIRKLLKRFLATPMKRSHFLAAMMISRLVFMLPEFVVLLFFARVVFGVTSHGGYVAVMILILLGAVEFAGIGLLVASRAATIETVSGLMNLVMLPMWILSGIFFSNERFPDLMQPIIQILPLTPLINALRGVMLEGASIMSLGPELLTMGVWAVVTFAIALATFRWQ